MTSMSVALRDGKRVDAEFAGFTIRTDQTAENGGAGSAPQPFDLFLASIATCAGYYVKAYCDARRIPTEGVSLTMRIDRDPERKRISRLAIDILLPPDFPDDHRDGVVRAADHCAVKKHILEPPVFEIAARLAETACATA